MGGSAREEFFRDPAVVAALDDYAEAALDYLEAGGVETDVGDPAAFLGERGLRAAADIVIDVQWTVGHPDQVLRPLCPDGSDHCYPKCRMIKGEWRCVWVCRCP